MIRFRKAFLCLAAPLLLTSCIGLSSVKPVSSEESVSNGESISSSPGTPNGQPFLVAYFSCTNNTEAVAEKINVAIDGDLEEIMPLVPYTNEDLDYNNSESRASKEQNDPAARPEIVNELNVDSADVVFVGYPIWWGRLPKIMYTFFDTYDFANKTIVPFATSGSSGISSSVSEIRNLEPNASVFEGRRFASSVSQTEIDSWVNELGL